MLVECAAGPRPVLPDTGGSHTGDDPRCFGAVAVPRAHRELRAARAEGQVPRQHPRLGLVSAQPAGHTRHLHARVRLLHPVPAAGRRQRPAGRVRVLPVHRAGGVELLLHHRNRQHGRADRRRAAAAQVLLPAVRPGRRQRDRGGHRDLHRDGPAARGLPRGRQHLLDDRAAAGAAGAAGRVQPGRRAGAGDPQRPVPGCELPGQRLAQPAVLRQPDHLPDHLRHRPVREVPVATAVRVQPGDRVRRGVPGRAVRPAVAVGRPARLPRRGVRRRAGARLDLLPQGLAGRERGAVRARANGGPAITVDGVSKKFRLHRDRRTNLKEVVTARHRRNRYDEFWALRDISLAIPRGSTYGLVGPNGSGKSTLLKLIAGIHRPTSGTISADGQPGHAVVAGEPMRVRIHYEAREPVPRPVFGLGFYTDTDIYVSGSNSRDEDGDPGVVSGRGYVDHVFDRCPLNPGSYVVTAAVTDWSFAHRFDYWDHAFELHVRAGSAADHAGLVELPGVWSTPAAAPVGEVARPG